MSDQSVNRELRRIARMVREGQCSNGAALRLAQQTITAASGAPDPEDDESAILWPAKTSKEVERRREAQAAARHTAAYRDDDYRSICPGGIDS